MVSELPLGCWADLPPIVCPRVDDHVTREGAKPPISHQEMGNNGLIA